MRAYRESFPSENGRRGLTQEELLQRMRDADSGYAQRYSHATVSRWESGATRPTEERLRVFGKALGLSETEVEGLMLLAGLASGAVAEQAVPHLPARSDPEDLEDLETSDEEAESPAGRTGLLGDLARFWLLRCLPLGAGISLFGLLLSFLGWDPGWMPVAYVGITLVLVLCQGFLVPGNGVPLREFFWVTIFFTLTTPLLQFAPLGMDHYNLHVIDELTGTAVPYLLAMLLNLGLSSCAGTMFHVVWRNKYGTEAGEGDSLRRAAWVVLPPVALVYGVAVVITNLSVCLQLTLLMSVLAIVFVILLTLRDPRLNLTERDQRMLFPAAVTVAIVSSGLGMATIMAVYLHPDIPAVLPNHSLLGSWEIDFAGLGYTREEALGLLNVGYMWSSVCYWVYMTFVVGSSFIVAVYRIGRGGTNGVEPAQEAGWLVQQSESTETSQRRVVRLTPVLAFLSGLILGRGRSGRVSA